MYLLPFAARLMAWALVRSASSAPFSPCCLGIFCSAAWCGIAYWALLLRLRTCAPPFCPARTFYCLAALHTTRPSTFVRAYTAAYHL